MALSLFETTLGAFLVILSQTISAGRPFSYTNHPDGANLQLVTATAAISDLIAALAIITNSN